LTHGGPTHLACTLPSRPRSCPFASSGAPPGLHSFPTRRSSDLHVGHPSAAKLGGPRIVRAVEQPARERIHFHRPGVAHDTRHERSEEHTSELQSRENLVCRLLLETKKKAGARKASPPLGPGGAR